MKLLVLGGTAWLGGTVATAALDRGAEVVCVARGVSGSVPDGVRMVVADRDDPAALDAVRHEQWHAVVDVARPPASPPGRSGTLPPTCSRGSSSGRIRRARV